MHKPVQRFYWMLIQLSIQVLNYHDADGCGRLKYTLTSHQHHPHETNAALIARSPLIEPEGSLSGLPAHASTQACTLCFFD